MSISLSSFFCWVHSIVANFVSYSITFHSRTLFRYCCYPRCFSSWAEDVHGARLLCGVVFGFGCTLVLSFSLSLLLYLTSLFLFSLSLLFPLSPLSSFLSLLSPLSSLSSLSSSCIYTKVASPRWEALVDVLSRPKTKLSVKRDVLTLFNVIITTAPTIEERVQLRRVLNLVRRPPFFFLFFLQ